VLFPTLSALNSPPTATGECLPLCPPTPPSPSEAPAPQTLRRPRSVSHSVAPRQATPPLLGPSRTRSGSRRRRTVDALLGAAILRCCLRCGPSPDVARDVPYTTRHRPRCRRRCRCCPGPRCRRCSGSSLMLSLSPSSLKLLPSSLSLLLSSIANFVPNRTFEPLGRIAAHVSALKPRPLLSPSSLSRSSPSRSSLLSVSQKPPMPSPPRMLSLPVPVLSCRPRRRCCGRRRSRVLATPRLPDETRPPSSPPRPNPNSLSRLVPEPPSRHAPEPSSCVSPPTATPLPSRETRPTFLERDSD